MGYFPFFIDISKKPCLIVGGGTVALRKAEKLLPFGPEIRVVAPKICKALREMDLVFEERPFEDRDLQGAFMVIAATDDSEVNGRIYRLCTRDGILVNSVDDMENCGFIFPALVKKDSLTVGISTSGTAPAAAKLMRKRIEELLDDRFLRAAELYALCRGELKERFNSEDELANAADRLLKFCIESKKNPTKEMAEEFIRELVKK